MRTPDWENDYYRPSDIVYSPGQVLWIIYNLPILRGGQWPNDPASTSTEPLGGKQHNTQAPFIQASEVVAEIDVRLSRTGTSGKLLIAQIKGNCYWGELHRESKEALFYCVGVRRKKTSFSVWKAERNRKNT